MHHLFERIFDFLNHADHPQWDAAFIAMGFFGAGVFIILTMYLVGGIAKAQQAYAQPAQPLTPVYAAPAYVQPVTVYAPAAYGSPAYAPAVNYQPTPGWTGDSTSVTAQFGQPRDLSEVTN